MPRIVILTEGRSDPDSAKTATGLLRYRSRDVVALLDSTQAGRTAAEVLGVGGTTPFVSRLSEVRADTLAIGIAPAGGGLPTQWRRTIREAIRCRMDIWSGLHHFLGDDREFRELAARHRVRLVDFRRPPPGLTVSADLARRTPCHRIHTVGHDCSVGKMVTALELAHGMQARGRSVEFVATGQTGIMISGWGPPVDRIVSDFVAGAIETAVLEHQDREFLFIEGQGSLLHPFYSGVTLGLLHGCAPQSMILVFEPGRKLVKHTEHLIPPLPEVIRIYEQMAALVLPSKVVGLAANTSALLPGEAEKLVRRTEDRLGIVTADIVREGPERMLNAVLARHAELGFEEPAGAGAERLRQSGTAGRRPRKKR